MAQTPRELVVKTLRFENPERIPRDLWMLPWAVNHFPKEAEEIKQRFPSDLGHAPNSAYTPSPRVKGNMHEAGTYIDEWGCVFENVMRGVHGEVRNPIIPELAEWKSILNPPYETLPKNIPAGCEIVKTAKAATSKFMLANCCARPWERYQFLRGTENAMMDLALDEKDARSLVKAVHEFYLKEMEFWAKTDVDGVRFMDDWGSQTRLLISPDMWRDWFKPLYKDYCDLLHAHNKFAFFHSDGCIMDIIPDLIEVGVDCLNSQLFTMDIEAVGRAARGKITFWGEIDRQHILPSPNPQDGRDAVRKVARHLYTGKGGIIAQMEFGPGANPQTIIAAYEEWEKVGAGN